jgi:SAM-dependent methyltransferase
MTLRRAAGSFLSRLRDGFARSPAPRALADADAATIGDLDWRTLAPEAPIAFRCNLCGSGARSPLSALARELTGERAALSSLEPRRGVRGLGLSDAACYAAPLARVFDYENTYFHAEPRLDITAIDAARRGRYDFLIASDVFEHVAPPVSRAFDNALALLKPGGLFVMTVPYSLDEETVEHFPDLHDWSLEREGGAWTIANRTTDGRTQRFTDLVFHGGPGTTLEMRLFSRDALLREFARAGFGRVRVADEPYLPFGILWREPWSVPLVARAPAR